MAMPATPATARCRSVGTAPSCSKFIAQRLLLFVAASIFFLSLACRAPLQITDIKVNDKCDKLCQSGTTNYEAKCKVTFCDSIQYYATDKEPELGMLHSNTIPKEVYDIKIYTEGRDSQMAMFECK